MNNRFSVAEQMHSNNMPGSSVNRRLRGEILEGTINHCYHLDKIDRPETHKQRYRKTKCNVVELNSQLWNITLKNPCALLLRFGVSTTKQAKKKSSLGCLRCFMFNTHRNTQFNCW